MKSNKNTSRFWQILIAVFGYSIFFFAFTGLSPINLGSEIVGSGPDPYQYIWNADVFQKELSAGSNPFQTNRLAYPRGVSLLMHTYTPIIGVVNTLIQNPYLSCNIVLWLSFVLSGLGAFLLAKRYVENIILCLLVGFVFSFAPYKTAHLLEHYHLLLTATVPFFILILLRLFPKGKINFSKLDVIGIVGLFALGVVTVFSDYYTTFHLLYFAIGYFSFFYIRRLFTDWSLTKRILIVLGVFLVGHLALEHIHIQTDLDDKGAMYNTADLASVVVPAENSKVYGHSALFQTARKKSGYKGPNEQVMFFGFVLFVLFIISLFYIRTSEHKLLVYLSFFFLALSLPKIKLLGIPITYSPTGIFHYLPFLNNIRNPSRAVSLVYLFVPIVVAIFLNNVKQIKMVKWQNMLYAFLFMITVVEYWPQNYPRIIRSAVSDYYSDVGKDENVKVIWEVPTGVQDGFVAAGTFDILNLQQQIEHKKNLLGGYISRLDSSYFQDFREDKVFSFVNNPHQELSIPKENEVLEFLNHHNPDVVVVNHKDEESRDIVQLLLSKYIIKTEEHSTATIHYLGNYSIK